MTGKLLHHYTSKEEIDLEGFREKMNSLLGMISSVEGYKKKLDANLKKAEFGKTLGEFRILVPFSKDGKAKYSGSFKEDLKGFFQILDFADYTVYQLTLACNYCGASIEYALKEKWDALEKLIESTKDKGLSFLIRDKSYHEQGIMMMPGLISYGYPPIVDKQKKYYWRTIEVKQTELVYSDIHATLGEAEFKRMKEKLESISKGLTGLVEEMDKLKSFYTKYKDYMHVITSIGINSELSAIKTIAKAVGSYSEHTSKQLLKFKK